MPICILFVCFNYAHYAHHISYFCQANALLQRLEPHASAGRMGHFALYICVVLGHQVQRSRCSANLLQPISCKTVARLSPPGPRHNSAAGYRQWCLRSEARNCLVCSGIAPFLSLCCNRHWIQSLRLRRRRHWRHTTILRVVIIAIICIITLNDFFCQISIIPIMMFMFINCVSQVG